MKTDLSLYIHIPFCVKKCRYCDFLSYRAEGRAQEDYINGLLREIRVAGLKYGGRKVITVYIGGGTPSLLPADLIKAVMDAVKEAFSLAEDAEISIEVNPGTADASKLKTYRNIGINRISFGLQSALDKELKLLGRIHDYDTFLKSYSEARNAGFDNINVDLISALPGQSEQDYELSLRRVAELKPEHISAYSLQLEEGTWLYDHRDQYEWPDEDLDRELYWMTKKVLKEYGYKRYEISNYSLPGYECRHNKVYWQRGNYLGLGLGAASLIDEVRFNNTSDPGMYPDQGYINIEELSLNDRMAEFMFLGLRLTEGIDPEAFYAAFGVSIDRVYGTVLDKYRKDGLIVRNGNIRLTDYGLDISNYVFSGFLLDDGGTDE